MTAKLHNHITPQLLLQAYASGIFPMSESIDSPDIFWVDPKRRGIFPLDQFHTSKSLARKIRNNKYDCRINTCFQTVIKNCADRKDTWISAPIFKLYCQLHHTGHAHSFEVFYNNNLIGGVYGITIGSIFFGESMFSKKTDGSKIALKYLIDHLNKRHFSLFDTQFITSHLASLGAIEISRKKYHQLLAVSLKKSADFI